MPVKILEEMIENYSNGENTAKQKQNIHNKFSKQGSSFISKKISVRIASNTFVFIH